MPHIQPGKKEEAFAGRDDAFQKRADELFCLLVDDVLCTEEIISSTPP